MAGGRRSVGVATRCCPAGRSRRSSCRLGGAWRAGVLAPLGWLPLSTDDQQRQHPGDREQDRPGSDGAPAHGNQEGALAPALMSVLTPADPSAFMTTTDQSPSRASQVSVWRAGSVHGRLPDSLLSGRRRTALGGMGGVARPKRLVVEVRDRRVVDVAQTGRHRGARAIPANKGSPVRGAHLFSCLEMALAQPTCGRLNARRSDAISVTAAPTYACRVAAISSARSAM